jgi:hypothetical protein
MQHAFQELFPPKQFYLVLPHSIIVSGSLVIDSLDNLGIVGR